MKLLQTITSGHPYPLTGEEKGSKIAVADF
jgi:hypothetical protein